MIKSTLIPAKSISVLTWALVAVGLVVTVVLNAEPSNAQEKSNGQEKQGEKKAAPSANVATAKPALVVNVVKPQTMTMTKKLQSNGNVVAWQEAVIGTETNGLRLNQVNANVGDFVKRGQVLAVFASETIAADLAVTQASVVEAQASLTEAKSNAARARQIQDTGALSQQQVTQLFTAEQTAAARLQAVRAQLKVQQIRLKNTSVSAPDDGIISARTATVGAVSGAGQELFRLIRKGRLEWRAEVPSAELTAITPGMDVEVQASGVSVKGKVRVISPSVDAQTRNGLVYVDLPANAALKNGMFASGNFDIGSAQVLSVPQQTLVVRDGFTYLFYLSGDRVTSLKVKTGRREGDRIEVIAEQGLKADMQIVATGAAFLNTGDLVKVVK
jgi:HlyD family secretion protein